MTPLSFTDLLDFRFSYNFLKLKLFLNFILHKVELDQHEFDTIAAAAAKIFHDRMAQNPFHTNGLFAFSEDITVFIRQNFELPAYDFNLTDLVYIVFCLCLLSCTEEMKNAEHPQGIKIKLSYLIRNISEAGLPAGLAQRELALDSLFHIPFKLTAGTGTMNFREKLTIIINNMETLFHAAVRARRDRELEYPLLTAHADMLFSHAAQLITTNMNTGVLLNVCFLLLKSAGYISLVLNRS